MLSFVMITIIPQYPRNNSREVQQKYILILWHSRGLLGGYLLAAFSPVAMDEKCVTVVAVVGGSMILVLGEYYLVKLVAGIRYSKDEVVAYEDLAKMGVDTFATNREIEELFRRIKCEVKNDHA